MTAHEHFNMDEFVGQFQTALKVTAPRKRAFLLSWMQVLASVPDLDMLAHLPLFLGSLLDCLCDPFGEVRAQATKVLQVVPSLTLPLNARLSVRAGLDLLSIPIPGRPCQLRQ